MTEKEREVEREEGGRSWGVRAALAQDDDVAQVRSKTCNANLRRIMSEYM